MNISLVLHYRICLKKEIKNLSIVELLEMAELKLLFKVFSVTFMHLTFK